MTACPSKTAHLGISARFFFIVNHQQVIHRILPLTVPGLQGKAPDGDDGFDAFGKQARPARALLLDGPGTQPFTGRRRLSSRCRPGVLEIFLPRRRPFSFLTRSASKLEAVREAAGRNPTPWSALARNMAAGGRPRNPTPRNEEVVGPRSGRPVGYPTPRNEAKLVGPRSGRPVGEPHATSRSEASGAISGKPEGNPTP